MTAEFVFKRFVAISGCMYANSNECTDLYVQDVSSSTA